MFSWNEVTVKILFRFTWTGFILISAKVVHIIDKKKLILCSLQLVIIANIYTKQISSATSQVI